MEAAKSNAAAQQALMKMLYRADCPPSLELGEYQLGLLDKIRHSAVAKHVNDCPHCAVELAQLQGFVTRINPQIATEPNLVDRIGSGVRVLVAELLGVTQRPAIALRGSEATAPAIYMADDVQLSLEVQPDSEHLGRNMIIGLVIGPETTDWQATLWQANTLITSATIDDAGAFNFDDLAAGEYELIIGGGDTEVHAAVVI